MRENLKHNKSPYAILLNMLIAAASLFVNGFGVYLTIHASIGAGPWDVFNRGLSKTFGILYGNASITVCIIILIIDLLMREPIGIAMIIDSLVVGKTVDLFEYLNFVPVPKHLWSGVLMILVGLTIMGYTQYFYMRASLGCGPRDTLLVGLSKRCKKIHIPIGVVSIVLLAVVTLAGYLLGDMPGPGTILCAFATGPIMQFAFKTMRFDATTIRHQKLHATLKILLTPANWKVGRKEVSP